MKYTSHLSQATLLKRNLNFLTEVILPNKQKIMLRCPNLYLPHSCGILGTKVWYSNANGQNCLPTWELVEVDGGYLVSINPDFLKPLVIEAINEGNITELTNYKVTYTNSLRDQYQANKLWLEDSSNKICFVGIEQILTTDNDGDGYLVVNSTASANNLNNAISLQKEGHKAVILNCVMHTGITKIKYSSLVNNEYASLLQTAIATGVEVLAYKVNISYQEIKLTTKLPIYLATVLKSSFEKRN